MTPGKTIQSFKDFSLSKAILSALSDVGYEAPSPIQAETIPLLLKGKDVIGQAQTGTGKTAAFALPSLTNLDLKMTQPQVLVLTPTRELAIQVAETFQKYASHIKGFHVLPVYGGQDYKGQMRALKRGVHVIVGTPGRVMDHMRRGILKLDSLKTLVLDEADEMLRMGFIDDVQWVLEKSPDNRQVALFSATMPDQIRRIATKYLNEPEHITIKVKTVTAGTIRQRYWSVKGSHKLDALTRILEAEDFDAMLVFVRTKVATVELADKLAARGYACEALNGDIIQKKREKIIEGLKKQRLDIIVATDVAARGLDVSRISHVINYDLPYDTESYIHRIGRTGRAGNHGDAILFVTPREKRMLHVIEQSTKQKIELLELPSVKLINEKRIHNFKQRITDNLECASVVFFTELLEKYIEEQGVEPIKAAASLASLLQGESGLLLKNNVEKERSGWESADPDQERTSRKTRNKRDSSPNRGRKPGRRVDRGMQRYSIQVGREHGVLPTNIVGAIANESGLDSDNIGRIEIHDAFSTVDLPDGLPRELLKKIKKVWVCGQQLNIQKTGAYMESDGAIAQKKPRSRKTGEDRGGIFKRKPNRKPKRKSRKTSD